MYVAGYSTNAQEMGRMLHIDFLRRGALLCCVLLDMLSCLAQQLSNSCACIFFIDLLLLVFLMSAQVPLGKDEV